MVAVAFTPIAVAFSLLAVAFGPMAIAFLPVAPAPSWFSVRVEFTEKYFVFTFFN